MQRNVRIFADPTGVRLPDERIDKWCIDAVIDSNDQIVGKWFLQGTSGYDSSQSLYPFICHVDGRLDFGSGYSEDRFYTTNIRKKSIQVGNLVSIWDNHEKEHVCRITRIHEFGIGPSA
jgi:hypothetical protein